MANTLVLDDDSYNQVMLALIQRINHLKEVRDRSITPDFWQDKIDPAKAVLRDVQRQYRNVPA